MRDPERWYDSAYNTIYQFAAQTGGDPPEDDAMAGLQVQTVLAGGRLPTPLDPTH